MIEQVLWFLPTTGDNRYVGSNVGARSPTFDYLTSVARAADSLGFDGMLVPSGRWCDDPWVTTTAVAPFTRRTHFLIALRPGLISPVIAARMVSALDRLTEGRVRIMVVPGGDPRELAADGLHLGHDERYALTDEWLTVLRRVLTEPEVTFEGTYVKVIDARCPYPCVQRPHPPIYFGGSSPAGLRIAARHADVLLSWGEVPEQVADKIALARQLAADEGRTLKFGLRTHIVIREDEDAAWREADELIKYVDDAAVARQQTYYAGMDSVSQARISATHGGQRDRLRIGPNLWAGVGLVRGGCGTSLVGSPANIVRQLVPYEQLGIDTLVLSGYPHLEEAYRTAELLFPALPGWRKPDPLQVAGLHAVAAFADPGPARPRT
ncbi:MAG TPA: LLM class flavin-dependent oxidoreductase [Kofleriaceae bacterium]